MFKIVKKRELNPTVTEMVIEAPLIAKKAKAGQFIIIRAKEDSERIPLTIAHYDAAAGTVAIIFQIVGAGTMQLNSLKEGEYVHDFVGPLGKATEIEGLKNVCVVGGGVGCAIAYPIAKEMHEKGIDVTFIAGFRSKDIVILEDEMKAASNKSIICTDDGSYGIKGFTTALLQQEIDANIAEGRPQFDRVIAIGPDIMMKFLAEVTRPLIIPFDGSVNTISSGRITTSTGWLLPNPSSTQTNLVPRMSTRRSSTIVEPIILLSPIKSATNAFCGSL